MCVRVVMVGVVVWNGDGGNHDNKKQSIRQETGDNISPHTCVSPACLVNKTPTLHHDPHPLLPSAI
jgi:hypothetical protein